MNRLAYLRASSLQEAKQALALPGSIALAGGTTVVDLAKLGAMKPDLLVDIGGLAGLDAVRVDAGRLHIGALARMADVSRNADVLRLAPAIAESIERAASGQIRNMATIGGNILQRTRCAYFRDASTYAACNRRTPGSGCAAIGGVTPNHAILGATDACMATYPGDLAIVLAALDATVHTDMRDVALVDLFAEAGSGRETVLADDEIITAVSVAADAGAARSSYLKVRDRQSYEFAAVSVALAFDLTGNGPQIRVAVGGVATKPWRLPSVEAVLRAGPPSRARIAEAAATAAGDARSTPDNHFKMRLLTRTLERALLTALDLS
jgi:xanthine dehydrogenase YagS FAD-binding subunit